MYNFYIFLIIIVLIKPVNKFLLKNIFNTLEIIEEIVLSTFIIFITFLFIFKFIQKGSFNKLFNKLIMKITPVQVSTGIDVPSYEGHGHHCGLRVGGCRRVLQT